MGLPTMEEVLKAMRDNARTIKQEPDDVNNEIKGEMDYESNAGNRPEVKAEPID